MQFIDSVNVVARAGDGGDGVVSFRQEKFVDRGGPDGGDGGNGGDIILKASRNQNTLMQFRFQKELAAESGAAGSKRRKHGKAGQDLIVNLPVGTMVVDEAGTLLADLTTDGQEVVIARGGRGGFGNAHFVSSRRQAPRIAEKGEKGDVLAAQFELKMIADVGLVGLPNAGKSTLLSVISNARPEIADYPFTTITPNLGVVDVDGSTSLLFADIPGLIEGAAQGKGLGDEFLRHVERTAVLLHLIDAYQTDLASAYQTIQAELKAYKVDLSAKPQVVVLTKVEGLDQEMIADRLAGLKKIVPKGTKIFAISAQTKQNLPELLRAVRSTVEAERAKQAADEPKADKIPVLRLDPEPLSWKVTKQNEHNYLVTGRKIEKFAERTDFESPAGLQRLRDIMRRMGIIHELTRQGLIPGDKIHIAQKGRLTYT